VLERQGGEGAPRDARLGYVARRFAAPSMLIGAIAGLLLVLGSAGSAIADLYMPRKEERVSLGVLSWTAQTTPH
jgi:hypothetical protein